MAKPNFTAILSASSFKTGSVPGIARSKTFACVLGSAPKFDAVPENNFDAVDKDTCTSRPITDSQTMATPRNFQKASTYATQSPADTDVRH